MSGPRFTLDGDAALECRLATACAGIGRDVSAAIPAERIQALVLGGGYGRGEGGVLATPSGDAPYNDLEFFLLLHGAPRMNERRFGPSLHDIERRWTEALGIDVEFKVTSLAGLRDGPTTMFVHDLVQGHRVILGPTSALDACAHHADAARIPVSEAVRLLFNRCSGLLFAGERLAATSFRAEDADFTGRNHAKLCLALGDAALAAAGRHHGSCRERAARLGAEADRLGVPATVRALHARGVEFKLHPVRSTASREELLSDHAHLRAAAWTAWSGLHARRLGRDFPTPAALADTGADTCPETSAARNPLIRLRAFGLSGLRNGLATRYPRDGLFRALTLLLWAPDDVPARLPFLSRHLVAPLASRADAVAAYTRLWHRYN